MDTGKLPSRWFDFVAKNQDKVTSLHTAVFFLCLEINRRTGYEGRFTLWTDIAMRCFRDVSIPEIQNTLRDLSYYGFVDIIYDSDPNTGWVMSFKWVPMFNYN